MKVIPEMCHAVHITFDINFVFLFFSTHDPIHSNKKSYCTKSQVIDTISILTP